VVDVAPLDAQGRRIGARDQKSAQGFATKAAATEAMSQLQTEKRDGTYIDPTRMTFGEYLDHWYADADAHGWEGNTQTEYGVSIRLHIKRYPIASTRLQALTSMQFRGHWQHLLREGKIRTNPKGEETFRGPLSRKTVQNVYIAVHAALNDAVAADPPLMRKNVASGTYTYSRRKHRGEMLVWSVEEMRAFQAFTVKDADHGLWWAALMTGMRRGELLGLRRRDLELAAARLHVRQQYARAGRAGLQFKTLKTGSSAWRTLDLDGETAAMLQAHLDAQEFRRRSWGPAYRSDLDLVFCHPDGSPYDPDVITTRFERRAEECPAAIRIRLHDCRHTHATLLLENGETEKYVAERLGDTVEMIHETYGHVTPRMRAGAVSRLAALIARPEVKEATSAVSPRTLARP